jgi:hypothetical protein
LTWISGQAQNVVDKVKKSVAAPQDLRQFDEAQSGATISGIRGQQTLIRKPRRNWRSARPL